MDWLGLPRSIDTNTKTPSDRIYREKDRTRHMLTKSKIDLNLQGCHYLRTGS